MKNILTPAIRRFSLRRSLSLSGVTYVMAGVSSTSGLHSRYASTTGGGCAAVQVAFLSLFSSPSPCPCLFSFSFPFPCSWPVARRLWTQSIDRVEGSSHHVFHQRAGELVCGLRCALNRGLARAAAVWRSRRRVKCRVNARSTDDAGLCRHHTVLYSTVLSCTACTKCKR